MKTFDWDIFKKRASPARFEWMIKNHDKPITEKQFVDMVVALPKEGFGKPNTSKSKDGRGHHWSKTRSPKVARIEYKNLKEVFGMFK